MLLDDSNNSLIETYNGKPIYEYGMQNDHKSSEKTGRRRRPIRQHMRQNVRAIFTEIFLPQGYPQTVSADYLAYQRWDTLQAFSSAQNGALATLAVLKGVGVGNEHATVLAATLTWLLKDGIGMMARIVFAWARGSRLDSDNKKWRLVADILNDASFVMELIAPTLPQFCFPPIACFASFLRSIVDVCGRTTRMAVIRHQAVRDNLADVAAKDGSQETLVNIFSLLCSLILLPTAEANPILSWVLFGFFTSVHIFANYRAVKSLQFETLNQSRFQIAVRYFMEHGKAPTIGWCNAQEPVLFTTGFSNSHSLQLGCLLSALPNEINLAEIIGPNSDSNAEMNGETTNGIEWKLMGHGNDADGQGTIFCVVQGNKAWMAIENRVSNEEEIFRALFAIEHFLHGKGWPSNSIITEFYREMTSKGWSIRTNQLNINEWRFCQKGNEKKHL